MLSRARLGLGIGARATGLGARPGHLAGAPAGVLAGARCRAGLTGAATSHSPPAPGSAEWPGSPSRGGGQPGARAGPAPTATTPWYVGSVSAGEHLVQAIKDGKTPLPQGFDSVEDFHLLLRLAGTPGSNRPLADDGTIGRLLGMDRLSVQALLARYAGVYGIPPPARTPRPRSLILKDLTWLVQRDPPVFGRLLGRLLGLSASQVEQLLAKHLPEVDPARAEHLCLARLRKLVTVAPALSVDQLALLLSSSRDRVALAVQQHMPEYGNFVVPKVPPGRLAALRRALADPAEPPLSHVEICARVGISKSTMDLHGPELHSEYVIRQYGGLRPEQLRLLVDLLLERQWSIADMGVELGMPANRLRWYIKHYYPKVVLPLRNCQPVWQLAPPEDFGQLTLAEYTRRFLPAESPVHQAPDDETLARLGTTLATSRDCDPASVSNMVPSFDPDAHATAPGGDLRLLAPNFDRGFRQRLRALVGLRPPLADTEMSTQLGVPVAVIVRHIVTPELGQLEHDYHTALALGTEEILALRRLGSEVHPAGGRMRHTVREIARAMDLPPDRTYCLLHRYCPEYFFLALPAEAGSGPGGMYVPEGKLGELVSAVIGRYPAPILHQVAADLGCALPQVVNSLRAHASQTRLPFKAPSYGRHPCARVFELEQIKKEKPDISPSAICLLANINSKQLIECRPFL
ncbi:hypothetical protein H696_06061 [Fonticula alba]|uniref:Uncharacterized protein n=1 Tax=Fonticula alba TaxID=691883 RepID=A0A058Z0W0_FONAL|nr:hypothetical protein H696_06061 [Fonticula alba]KCV67543.1 hypothetical protein H696_06061 [Fonticula alba]|eukprot:XP_009498104.1 hypothetical protein H696_06061 [Fonticula alba]